MANIPTNIAQWSATAGSNQPDSGDTFTPQVDLQAVQAAVRSIYSQDTIASGATTDLSTITAGYITISGTATITALGTLSAGMRKICVFSGAATLTHNGTSLILPGGANITTASGDVAEFESLGSGNWRCTRYQKASGAAVVVATPSNVSDGDKGDITVSSGTWTIDNDAVTYAKIQNVSATSRVLGRKTSGAGDTEECTLSELLDFIGSAAQGDILYRDAAAWARLGAGTSGHYLKTQGAGANPAWAAVSGGGLTLLGTLTTTSGATQTLNSLTLTGYIYLYILFNAVSLSTVGTVDINGSPATNTLDPATGTLRGWGILDLTSGAYYGLANDVDSNSGGRLIHATGISTASTSLSFAASAGTFDAGAIKVYGGA